MQFAMLAELVESAATGEWEPIEEWAEKVTQESAAIVATETAKLIAATASRMHTEATESNAPTEATRSRCLEYKHDAQASESADTLTASRIG